MKWYKRLSIYLRLLFNPANVRIEGKCIKCGQCCRRLLLVGDKKNIDSIEEFVRLKKRRPEYAVFKVSGTNSDGDIEFECSMLREDGTCSDYKKRPDVCVGYPSKGMFMRRGSLNPGCGYTDTPIVSFEEMLNAETPVKPNFELTDEPPQET